ncbi:hypothetical protein I8I78_001298, partial [Enterobacter cloacae]|nr:hypothetical protein [Enterobacter cloacae]
MTVAKDSSTDDIVHGNDLRGMDDFYVRTTEFLCPYLKCRIKATPCSYRSENVNQSYFKYTGEHKSGCGIHDAKNRNRNNSNDEKTHNSPPAPFISILRLENDERIHREKNDDRTRKVNDEEDVVREHPVSSSSIKPIVDYYLSGVNNNEFLSIPSYEKRTYNETFQKLKYKPDVKYCKPAIYFGALQSNLTLDPNADEYEIVFLARKKGTKEAFRLKVDASSWNLSQKDVFFKEYEKQREKAERYRKSLFDKKTKSYKKANKFLTVFFFGFPDDKEPLLLHTNHFKLVYVSFIDDVKDTFNTSNEMSVISKTDLYELTANETNVSEVEVNEVNYVDSDCLNSASF